MIAQEIPMLIKKSWNTLADDNTERATIDINVKQTQFNILNPIPKMGFCILPSIILRTINR